MSDEITIECPECKAQFLVPHEYCGGVVDCSECGTPFEILALPEDIEKQMMNKARKKKRESSTNTVAISRNDLGMIPELEKVQIR